MVHEARGRSDGAAAGGERADLSWTVYQRLSDMFGPDWRSIRKEWRRPGSVRGRAGDACRKAIAWLAATAVDGEGTS